MPSFLRFTRVALPCSALLLASTPLLAQVTDSQRAAARDLFKEGDALQRSGKLVEALDKFQRAQAVFDAPTNLLRIAECEAALGRLVESAEAFRAVLRAQLPAGSPPAFQAAMDQARAELAQVEPRVPKVVVDVQPSKIANLQLQIDGQNVSAALVGAPMPLDPGVHKIVASAPGYAAAEQQVVLKEQDSKTASLSLKAAPASADAAGGAGGVVVAGTAGTGGAPSTAPSSGQDGTIPPPPPALVGAPEPAPPKATRPALLLGAHIGWDIPSGKIPLDATNSADMKDVGSSGPLLGVDGGIRFARQWYGGLTLEHAELGSGNHSSLQGVPNYTNVSNASSNTTSLGAVLGLVVTPERPGFYGHVGLAARWYNVKLEGATNPPTYTSPEVVLGAGVWIPSGRHFVILPEATLSLGTFNASNPDGSAVAGNTQGHIFIMLGVAGFYSVGL